MSHGHENLVENNFMGVPNLKLGIWAFLGSECMFFGSLIGVYFFYKDKSLTGPLPEDVFSVNVTSISTFLLLMSSFTMALGVDAMKRHMPRRCQAFLAATALLGASFVGFQVYEFYHFYQLGLTLQGSLFGSSFYTMTGFHGAHVTVGVIWLTMCNLMIGNGRIKDFLPVEVSGLYWHFVDIVWIIIFTFVYLLEFVR
jgi:heme/copper-type cytochrome/quinol oxidase subunit 3